MSELTLLYWYLGGLLGLVLLSLLIAWWRTPKKHSPMIKIIETNHPSTIEEYKQILSPETVREEARDSLILRYGEDELTRVKKERKE